MHRLLTPAKCVAKIISSERGIRMQKAADCEVAAKPAMGVKTNLPERPKRTASWKQLFILLVPCLALAGCGPSTTPEPEAMLETKCGWQEFEGLGPGPGVGTLIITDSRDGYESEHEYNVKPPIEDHEIQESAFFLARYDIGCRYPGIGDKEIAASLITAGTDHTWLMDSLGTLSFSATISARPQTDARIVVEILENVDGDCQRVGVYWVCADGIVLKEAVIDEHTCFYESLTRVDYYKISSLQIKYERSELPRIMSCFNAQVTKPEQYRLCFSGPDKHRDFSLGEAKDLFSSLAKDGFVLSRKVNPDLPPNMSSYLKITEYTSLTEDGEIEAQTFYLSPEGRLVHMQDYLSYSYHNDERELFAGLFWWESNPVLDYNEFLKLLKDQ